MYVAFAVCPSGVIRDFACSGRITVGFCRAVVDAYGIFQDIRFGVQGQQFHIGLQCMRGDIIVGIDECDIFSVRLVQSSVARRAQSTVFRAMDDTESSVFPYPCVTKGSASVRRTIVHEDDFVVLHVLPCYAFQAEVKVGFHLIYRDDDGEFHASFLRLQCFKFYSSKMRHIVPLLSGGRDDDGRIVCFPQTVGRCPQDAV